MARTFLALAAGLLLSVSSGCAVCQSPFDFCYPAYGGRWPQESNGPSRAGSAFGGVTYSGETVMMEDGEPGVSTQPVPAGQPPMETEVEMSDPAPMFVPRQPAGGTSAPQAPFADDLSP